MTTEHIVSCRQALAIIRGCRLELSSLISFVTLAQHHSADMLVGKDAVDISYIMERVWSLEAELCKLESLKSRKLDREG